MPSSAGSRNPVRPAIVLYRAVKGAELRSIEDTNQFSNLAGLENKYFSTSLEGAQSFAEQASAAYGDGPYGIVATSIPAELITHEMECTVDQGAIPTITISSELLPELAPPEILYRPEDLTENGG